MKSESVAYPSIHNGNSCQNARPILATLAFLGFVSLLSSRTSYETGTGSVLRGKFSGKRFEHFGGAVQRGYFSTTGAFGDSDTFHFAAVTDLDQLSKDTESKKLQFKSLLLPGTLQYDSDKNIYSVEFGEYRTLYSKHNEAGRGMELSELTLYQDRLLTFDDRTGSVFEILSKEDGKESYVVPRFVITEGDGNTDKGMKWEWATVKGDELYIGSFGKEYTNPDGSIANTNNLWIAILTSEGEVKRQDWMDEYNFVKKALNINFPGYCIHEAVLWSEHLKQWVFLPRRISETEYDEELDEKKGSNKVILVDENFNEAKVVEVQLKEVNPLHGFSTAAFVPGSKDKHAVALRSVEEDCVGGDEDFCKQRTYMIVFDVLTGKVLMDEVQIKIDFPGVKFEGIEFVDINTKDPNEKK